MKAIEKIFEKAYMQGRKSLFENEVYDIFDMFGLNTPKRVILPINGTESIVDALNNIQGEKIVLKIISAKTLHKTESGAVKICVREKAEQTITELKKSFPKADGILISEFIAHSAFALGQELMLGARCDDAFGPVIVLGSGGTDTEELASVLKQGPSILAVDTENVDFKNFLNKTWIWNYTSGKVRGGQKLAEDDVILKWLEAFASLMLYFSNNGRSQWMIEELETNPLAICCGKITALDGVLRFKKSLSDKRVLPYAKTIWSLLKPSTIAVAGVSETKVNMGRIILRNVLDAGFPKEKIWILKNSASEIDGVKCCACAKDFPHTIDMFVIAVPSNAVIEVLNDAAQSGKVRGVVLISGGMGEKEGSAIVSDKIMDIIAEGKRINSEFGLSGGNSLGIVSNPAKVNTLFIPKEKLIAPSGENYSDTAFISQSGAFIIVVASKMSWFKPVYSVSVGNQMDITVVDYVEQLCSDDSIKVICAYIEGLKSGDGLRLAYAVKKAVSVGKKVIIYKAGRTVHGQKAVMGHTASIAGSFAVAHEVLSYAGAYMVQTFEDFEDCVQMCSCYADIKPESGRVFIMSNAGFETAGMADNIKSGDLLTVPTPDKKLFIKLSDVLSKFKLDSIVDIRNPLDITPMANDEAILEVAEEILASDNYDSLIISAVPLTPAMKTLACEGLENSVPAKLGKLMRKYGKPVIFCVAAGGLYDDYCELAQKEGLAVFRSADRAVKSVSEFLRLS